MNQFYLISALFSLWLVVISVFVFRLLSHYQKLTKGVAQKDLISALNNYIAKTKNNEEDIAKLDDQILAVKKSSERHIQRIGFKRFNPFTDTGGNQSFILSLLDENMSGIVISSLHSRENTRAYAKKVELGKCLDQVLSKEEEQVIKDSLKQK